MPALLTEEQAVVLRAVALADLCEPSTIANAIGLTVADQLDQLHAAGVVMRQGARRLDRTRNTLYTISTTGRDRLQAYAAGFRHRITAGTTVPVMAAARTAHLTTRGLYTGAELQPYDGRPGAMDAFALPSRMGRRLHYRDGRVLPADAPQPSDFDSWGPISTARTDLPALTRALDSLGYAVGIRTETEA